MLNATPGWLGNIGVALSDHLLWLFFFLEVKINVFFFFLLLPDEKHKCVWGQQIQLTFRKKIILQKKRRNFLSETMGALVLPAKEYYT